MVITIEYGKWCYRTTREQLDRIGAPLDALLALEQRYATNQAKRNGWELLPGPPERRELDPFVVAFIWPACRVTEQSLDDRMDENWGPER